MTNEIELKKARLQLKKYNKIYDNVFFTNEFNFYIL